MKYKQQGDVICYAEKIPEGAVEDMENAQHKAGIIQHGEATGHKHQLHGDGFRFYTKDNTRYLRIVKPTALRHEEHDEQMFAPGDYRIGIVKEWDYDSEEERQVID